MNRRQYLKHAALLSSSSLFASQLLANIDAVQKKKSVLLRSAWQTVNIGDIGHTPGVLSILEKNLPEVALSLWPSDIGNGVEEILRKRFPHLTLVRSEEEIRAAFSESDFLLHGSGPSLMAGRELDRWRETTGKPYGVYGITFPGVYGPPTSATERKVAKDIETLNAAEFAYFRDSISLEVARGMGVTNKATGFVPDGAFAVDLQNEKAADAFLNEHGLERGRFMCVIPRLRYTPYWKIKDIPFDQKRHDRNELMKEHDHAPLREAIIAITRKTSSKILICPEDKTQVEVGKEMLFDPLPEDVKRKVVWRDRYWLTDEAVSTYRRSAGLFGLEMHSPIMCIGNGIPAIVCRFSEQTSKGVMWRDIGLGDWLFDMDVEADVRKIVPAVLEIAMDPAAAKTKALKAKTFVEQRHEETMHALRKKLFV